MRTFPVTFYAYMLKNYFVAVSTLYLLTHYKKAQKGIFDNRLLLK